MAYQRGSGHDGGRGMGGGGRDMECSRGWPQFIKNPKNETSENTAEVKNPHRGAYGTGGGGGMYKSRIAGFSFLADLLAEPHGDWVLIREELFWKI